MFYTLLKMHLIPPLKVEEEEEEADSSSDWLQHKLETKWIYWPLRPLKQSGKERLFVALPFATDFPIKMFSAVAVLQ